MTFRLVALMSVVLLLSLAAFGLLMGHYQDQVMQEVARTASAASRATLQSLEFGDATAAVALMEWTSESSLPQRQRKGATGEPGETYKVRSIVRTANRPDGTAGEAEVLQETFEGPRGPNPERADGAFVANRRTIVVRAGMDEDGGQVREMNEFVGPDGEAIRVLIQELACRDEDTPQTCERLQSLARKIDKEGSGAAQSEFFIDIAEVHADAGLRDDIVMLRIPTFVNVKDGDAMHMRTQTSDEDHVHENVLIEKHNEFQLPIAVDDYQHLFASLRSKYLFLFLGVFVVGTVLSTGLASRFTRPIRRLDAGLRRLSDGDLDVEVPVQGHDEIARLGEAFNDMTGKLRANRDRARELVRREKLSALGGLAAGVAHDVRNPLHSIGLTLQHLGDACRPEDGKRAEEFDQGLEIIRGEIRRLDQLVGNFLQFSRSEQRERQAVDLSELLEETANLIRKEAEWRNIKLELDLLPMAPPIDADAEGLRASLLNLVMNSFHAMPDGGTLTLRLALDQQNLVVEVVDDGSGIPADDLEKVFEFAYTTREGGNGLGLAMVHECVVEDHGGRVTLDSEPERGTTVRLALPIRTHAPDDDPAKGN